MSDVLLDGANHSCKAGSAVGQILYMADDFDAPLDGFAEYSKSEPTPSTLQRHLNLNLLIEDSHGKLVDAQLGIVDPRPIVQRKTPVVPRTSDSAVGNVAFG